MRGWARQLTVFAHPAQACRGTNGVRSPACRGIVFLSITACQDGWHRPVLSLFAKVFIVFSCTLPKVTYSQKFAFAQRSGAMKAPVGLLSDRTVLRSKMEGPRPDKFTLTRPGFCGNLSQQFNIYIFYLFAQYLRGWATPLFDFSSRYITDWQDLPKKRRHDRSVL